MLEKRGIPLMLKCYMEVPLSSGLRVSRRVRGGEIKFATVFYRRMRVIAFLPYWPRRVVSRALLKGRSSGAAAKQFGPPDTIWPHNSLSL